MTNFLYYSTVKHVTHTGMSRYHFFQDRKPSLTYQSSYIANIVFIFHGR